MKRNIELDFIRTVVILNALILHFDTKYILGYISYPFEFFQNCLFTVGAFFFFTSGVMAYRVYLPRYEKDRKRTSLSLLKKGATLLIIYIVYVTFLSTVNDRERPDTLFGFLFSHDYFLKVLFSFGVLFLITPILLRVIQWKKSCLFLIILSLNGIYLVWSLIGSDSYVINYLIFKRNLFLYALLPSFLIYFYGMFFSMHERGTQSKNMGMASWKNTLVVLAIFAFVGLLAYNEVSRITGIFDNSLVAPLRETILLVFTIKFVNYLWVNWKTIFSSIRYSNSLFLGVESLTTYVTGNFIMGMFHLGSNNLYIKVVVLTSMLALTYTVTRWRWLAKKAKEGETT